MKDKTKFKKVVEEQIGFPVGVTFIMIVAILLAILFPASNIEKYILVFFSGMVFAGWGYVIVYYFQNREVYWIKK